MIDGGESVKIKKFTDLRAWQEGHKLVLQIYAITRSFPKEETFGLINQMRRAVVSVTSNIAEGFSRQSFREKIQFYSISQGSVTEIQNQLLIAKDVNYLQPEKFQEVANQTVMVHKILNGLIKTTKNILDS